MRKLLYLVFAIVLVSSCNRPIAKFMIENSKNASAPAKIKFKNESKKADKFYWDFGDGNTSTVSNPTHKYLMSGNYTVELVAAKGKKKAKTKKKVHIQAPVVCLVLIETPYGEMEVELYDETPKHRDNFIKLRPKSFF